jgi:hypothetical protein
MVPAVKRQIDMNRMRADLAAASVEMLSAQCAADRVRLQYSLQDIAIFGDPQALKRAITSAESMQKFFSQVAAELRRLREDNR